MLNDKYLQSSQGESPGKGGRKNIKKIKKGDDLADATKEAAEEEKERRRRIEDRQKLVCLISNYFPWNLKFSYS